MNVNIRKIFLNLLNKIDATTSDEVIKDSFVSDEVKKSINTVKDNEIKQFTPFRNGVDVKSITFNVKLLKDGVLVDTTLHDLGYTYEDVKDKVSDFTNAYLLFNFYTNNNIGTRELVATNQIFLDILPEYNDVVQASSSVISNNNLHLLGLPMYSQKGILKPLDEINLSFRVTSPNYDTNTSNDSYFLYLINDLNIRYETIYYTVSLFLPLSGYTHYLGNKNRGCYLNEVIGVTSSPIKISDDLSTKPNYEFLGINDLNITYTDGHLTMTFYEITTI